MRRVIVYPMTTRIVPYKEDGSPMKMWPPLAAHGKLLLEREEKPEEGLFYYDVPPHGGGPEKPAVVLIHGLGDEADSWRRLIPRLSAAGYRTLAPDLPGFGRSRTGDRASIGGHTKAILRLIGEAVRPGPSSPVVLAGSSMGAIIAEAAAFKRPDLVQGLILLDGGLPLSGGPSPGLALMALPVLGKRWYRGFRGNPEGAYRSLAPYYANLEGLPPEDRQFLRERVMARVESGVQERAYFSSLRSMLRACLFSVPAFTRRLKAFSGKVLILWGERDLVLPASSAEALRWTLPAAAFRLIPGAGHLPHQEAAAETAAEIGEFLA
jgi:pimeloyl-ACP methyl ester carboxylesterase